MKNNCRPLTFFQLLPFGFQVILWLLVNTATAQTYTPAPGAPTAIHQGGQQGMATGMSNFTSFRKREKSAHKAWLQCNDSHYYNHPEFGVLPDCAPENCVEILSKRKIDERTFRSITDTNVVYIQKALGELNMLKNNQWITIDHHLEATGKGTYRSINTREPVSINISNRDIAIHTVSGKVSFNNWTLLATKNGEKVKLSSANFTNYTIGEDGLYVKNIFKGIDAEIRVYRGAIKTNFIIRSNEFGSFEELIFRDDFNRGNNTKIRFTENEQLKKGVGQLTVFNNGKDALKVDAGVAYARNNKSKTIALAYGIDEKAMDVIVPADWITENIGQYELVVDPIVTASATLAQVSITGSRYNGTCNFTNSCDYTLNVSQPANTSVTNIMYSFTYTANGSTCWQMDGGVKIGTATCISPSASGYTWFCNAIGGGNCTATNVSLYSDLASCMPVPSCAVQNIPFVLKFYRSCWGATGCSNTCIGAGSPWIMTLECKELAFNSPSDPITLSSASVCQGGTLNVSTSFSSTLTPISYSWSFDPSGTPVAATGSSASITVPGSATNTLYLTATDACNNTAFASKSFTVSAPVSTTENITICASALPYTWNGQNITAAGMAVATYTTPSLVTGCDSTVTLNLTVNPPKTYTENITICASALPYTWNGQNITAAGTAVATYTTPSLVTGCDSTVTLNLTVNASPVISSQPGNVTVYIGDMAVITVNASGAGPLSYQWQVNTGGGFSNISNNSNYSGADGPSLTITNTTLSMSGYAYRCIIAGICNQVAISNDAQLVVNKHPQTISLPSPANGSTVVVTYGDSPFSAAATASSGLQVTYSSSNNAVATIDASGQITITGAGISIITLEQPGDGNYLAASAIQFTIQVNKKDLYVQADDKSRPYGETNPALTITYSGFVNGENSSVITEPGIATQVVITTIPGTYTITLLGGTAANYNLILTNGTFTVTGARVFITLQPQDQSACEDEQVTFITKATAASALVTVVYQWQESMDGSNWQSISSASSASVTIDAVSSRYVRCLIEAPGTLEPTQAAFFTVNPLPDVRAYKSNDLDCNVSSTKLNAAGAVSYVWTPVSGLSNARIANPVATPSDSITYTVTGTDAKGCTNSDNIHIEISTIKTGENVVANAFTPNGDGKNDCFGIKYWGVIEKFDITIYNRYGQRVFSSNIIGACWDGRFNGQQQPAGTYVYYIRSLTKCGIIERRGTVTLIR